MKRLLISIVALFAGASLVAGCSESPNDRMGERPSDRPPAASPPTTTSPPSTTTPPPSGSPSTTSPSGSPQSPSGGSTK
ncbi:MAG: hypothetical protein ACREJV_12905 [Candidatus Rokuibacteriota bacterium]